MNDKKSKLSLSDLERHLWEAAHIITGPIDASDINITWRCSSKLKQSQTLTTSNSEN